MKAQPLKRTDTGYTNCTPENATHVQINFPGPSGNLILPVVLGNATRAGTSCWSWNGDIDSPTLKPSILTQNHRFKCHSFVNDGKAQFLGDCSHELAGQTVDMLEVEP